MSRDAMHNPADAAEKGESNNGKIVGGVGAGIIGGIIGALLMGDYAIFPAAIVVGLLGAALGATFD